LRETVTVLVSLSILCISWPLRAQEKTVAQMLLIQVPDSCPAELLRAGLEELDVTPDTIKEVSETGTWADATKKHIADHNYEAVIGILRRDTGSEVHVATNADEAPTVIRTDGAGCDEAAAMAALYINRLVHSSRMSHRPTPALRLPPVASKPGETPDVPPAERALSPIRLSVEALGLAEANFRDQSPEMMGGELRLAVRSLKGIHCDLALAAAPFMGLTGPHAGLEGGGLIIASHLGYAFRWNRVELIIIVSGGLTNYFLRRDTINQWEQRILPRGELGLQVRLPLRLDLLAEVTALWEPWRIQANSETLGTKWTIGGAGLGIRLGTSFHFFGKSKEPFSTEN
jgi:hypothetical protein